MLKAYSIVDLIAMVTMYHYESLNIGRTMGSEYLKLCEVFFIYEMPSGGLRRRKFL